MKRVRFAGFGVLLALSSQVHALTPAELFAKVSPSVWRVKTYDKDGAAVSSGSAVVVGTEQLVTNCHVLNKAARITIVQDNMTLGATLEMWDKQRDLCQIKARNLPAQPLKLGLASALVVGQNVYAIGNPLGLELTLSAGLISSLRRDSSGKLQAIQISAPISSGSSGGGLFDEQGRLVGITTSSLGSTTGVAQNLNFAIPADWIRELPERHAAQLKKVEPEKPVAAAAPVAAKPSAAASSSKVWRYALKDMYFKRWTLDVAVRQEEGGTIVEEMAVDSGGVETLRWEAGDAPLRARALANNIEWIDVSPFLMTEEGLSAKLLTARKLKLFGSEFSIDVRNVGSEQILVGSERLTASKIEIQGKNIAAPAGSVYTTNANVQSFVLRVWYAKNVGRMVKLFYSSRGGANGIARDQYEVNLLAVPNAKQGG